MKRAIRRIAILLVAVFTFPVFAAGFVFHVCKHWFEFGEECADLAEDEWIGWK